SLSDLIQLLKFVIDDSKLKIEPQALEELAQAADGSFRDGLSLLDQVINYAQGKITAELTEEVLGLTGSKTTADFLDLLMDNKTSEALDFVSKLTFAGKDLFQFQRDFLEYLRKVLLTKLRGADLSEGESNLRQKLQADKLPTKKLIKIIEVFQKAGLELKWAAIVNLPLELAVVEVTDQQNSDGRKQNGNGDTPADKDEHSVERPAEPKPKNNEEVLNLVIEKWPQVLEKIKEYNHSLISSLKLAIPVAVEGKELVLVFPYKFHKDTIEARKNRVVVDQVLEDVLGIKLMARPVLKAEIGNVETTPNNSNLVESALKIMGGEVE
ncbi:MAG TPA: hypothetical protein VGQ87_03210, partial [Patescibacteria group bacterium]|nr:hypothetical protein [Patescibacteria group bacterium]